MIFIICNMLGIFIIKMLISLRNKIINKIFLSIFHSLSKYQISNKPSKSQQITISHYKIVNLNFSFIGNKNFKNPKKQTDLTTKVNLKKEDSQEGISEDLLGFKCNTLFEQNKNKM
jgi:hypothetical protein